MLVLTRKVSEVIRIGADVRVMVVGIEPGRVRLGVVAPQDVNIGREDGPIEEVG